MHSVRKYPIWHTSHRTPKQNVPPHIVFWGGGLPFPHPSIFHITFVSKPKIFAFLRRKFPFNLNNRFLKARLSSTNFFSFHSHKTWDVQNFLGGLPGHPSKFPIFDLDLPPRKFFTCHFSAMLAKRMIVNDLTKDGGGERAMDNRVDEMMKIFWAESSGQLSEISDFWPGGFGPENFMNFANFTKYQSHKVIKLV